MRALTDRRGIGLMVDIQEGRSRGSACSGGRSWRLSA